MDVVETHSLTYGQALRVPVIWLQLKAARLVAADLLICFFIPHVRVIYQIISFRH
jgi:hypothetical protein